MMNSIRVLLSSFFALAIASVLSACASSPGTSISESLNDGGLRPNAKLGGAPASGQSFSWPSWLRPNPVASNAEGTSTYVSSPPPGKLISISPELILKQNAAKSTEIGSDIKRLFANPSSYRIGPGDVLSIVIWTHPELNAPPSAATTSDPSGQSALGTGFNVSSDGFIQFPFIGVIRVGGLTEYGARTLLLRELSKYLKNPQITVRVQGFRSSRIYIDGEVKTPGLLALTDIPLTLPDALSRAGGLTTSADRSAVAVTRGTVTTIISMQQLAELNVNPATIVLANGDLVRVLSREDSRVYVLGEVNRPAPLTMRNGRMSLAEALGESGGISQISADPRQIYVLRNVAVGNAEIYHLDARSPAAMAMADSFDLKPRDVVFVDPAPIVRWNRVISLLLPSGQLVNTARDIVK